MDQSSETKHCLKYQYRTREKERSQPDGCVDQEDALPGELHVLCDPEIPGSRDGRDGASYDQSVGSQPR